MAPFRVFRFAFFVCMVAFAAAACSSKPQPADLRRLTLPDLSKASPSVQEQLRDGYAALTRSIDTRDIRPVDLGDAYGRMGMLLMAAEFRNEAESAFLNAEALSPGQHRWPYYLGHVYRIKGDAPKSAAAFERARVLQPADVPTLVWLGNARLDEGRPEAAEPHFVAALAAPAAAGHRRVRSRTGGARAAGLRARRGGARTRALARSEGDHRPLPAGARVPGAGRCGQGHRAHAAARHARHQARRSAHARARQPAAQRARVRSGGRRRARPGRLGRGGGQFSEGPRARPGGAVAPPQAGHRAGAQGRYAAERSSSSNRPSGCRRPSPRRTTASASSWRRAASRSRRSTTGRPRSRPSPATSSRACSSPTC